MEGACQAMIITSTVNGMLMARVAAFATPNSNKIVDFWFRVPDLISIAGASENSPQCTLLLANHPEPVLTVHSADELIKALIKV